MKTFVEYKIREDGKCEVVREIYKESLFPASLSKDALITEKEKPAHPSFEEGQSVTTFIDPETGEYSFEVVGTPKVDELTQIKEQQTLMQQAIDDLIFGGAL